jgi:hypothetical protein
VRYMRDGEFLDSATQRVTVEAVTFNAQHNVFAVFEFKFDWQACREGGGGEGGGEGQPAGQSDGEGPPSESMAGPPSESVSVRVSRLARRVGSRGKKAGPVPRAAVPWDVPG